MARQLIVKQKGLKLDVKSYVHLTVLQEMLHQLDSGASADMLSSLDCVIPSTEKGQGDQGVSSSGSNAQHLLDPCHFHLCNLRVLWLPTLHTTYQLDSICHNACVLGV